MLLLVYICPLPASQPPSPLPRWVLGQWPAIDNWIIPKRINESFQQWLAGIYSDPRLNLPGNIALPSDDSDLNIIHSNLYYWHAQSLITSKNREMQGNDDFQPFFRLIASTVERSQLKKEPETRDIQSSSDQSSSEEKDRESSLTSKRLPIQRIRTLGNVLLLLHCSLPPVEVNPKIILTDSLIIASEFVNCLNSNADSGSGIGACFRLLVRV